MTANEIRIGNWVNVQPHNRYVQIIEIKSGRPDNLDFVRIRSPYLETQFAVEISQIVPIPLTKEILLKAGFKKDVNGILWFQITPDRHFELIHSQGYYYPQLAQSPEISCEVINVVSLNRIESVHQLQNLFFALTGEEIKIEL